MKTYSWVTVTQYVDIDTGELLDSMYAKQHYETIKTEKHVTRKHITNYKTHTIITKGIIRITKLSRRRTTQGKLF